MFDKSALYLLVLGYVGAVFKTNIATAISQLITRITSTIMVDDSIEQFVYQRAMDWVAGLKKKHISNNISFIQDWNYSKRSGKFIVPVVGFNTFILYIGKLTWAKISIQKVPLVGTERTRMNISIIGVRHSKVIHEIKNQLIAPYRHDPQLLTNGDSIFLKPRSFNNVFFEEKERVIKSIDSWLNSKDFYDKHDITYKLGILLHGEPGTGKTSFAVALAHYLGWNIRICDMNSFMRGSIIISPATIFLVEEVDTVLGSSVESLETLRDQHNTIDKAEADRLSQNHNVDVVLQQIELDGVNMKSHIVGEFLQLLDGIKSPNNVIFIMTTNHREKLDHRLFRPGRIDLDINMGKLSKITALEMIQSYDIYDEEFINSLTFPINPSKLQQIILDYLNILDSLKPIDTGVTTLNFKKDEVI